MLSRDPIFLTEHIRAPTAEDPISCHIYIFGDWYNLRDPYSNGNIVMKIKDVIENTIKLHDAKKQPIDVFLETQYLYKSFCFTRYCPR